MRLSHDGEHLGGSLGNSREKIWLLRTGSRTSRRYHHDRVDRHILAFIGQRSLDRILAVCGGRFIGVTSWMGPCQLLTTATVGARRELIRMPTWPSSLPSHRDDQLRHDFVADSLG